MRKSLLLAGGVGFVGMTAQILVMREFVAACYGNELSFAVVLGSWLFWAALGSWVFSRLAARASSESIAPAVVVALVGFLVVAALIAARLLRVIWGIPAGAVIPFDLVMLSALGLLAPLCFLVGGLFCLVCRLAAAERAGESGPGEVGRVYVAEAVGAALGGAVFSFLLVRISLPIQTAFLLTSGGCALAALALPSRKRTSRGALLVLTVIGIAASIFAGRRLDFFLRGRAVEGYRLVDSGDSIYGRVSVLRRRKLAHIYVDGMLSATRPNLKAAEEAMLWPFLQNPEADRVLLIGGGTEGVIEAFLKNPLFKGTIDYVELDPLVIRMAEKHFPDLHELEAEGVTVLYGDGRLALRRAAKRYDLILLGLPEPRNAQINRFYTAEFFREAAAGLTRKGLLVFRVPSKRVSYPPELRRYLRCLDRTLREAFAHVLAAPSEQSVMFFAASSKGAVTSDAEQLIGRLLELMDRGYALKSVTPPEIEAAFGPAYQHLKNLEEILEAPGPVRVNRDFHPACYFYDFVWWSLRQQTHEEHQSPGGSWLKQLLETFDGVPLWGMLLGVLVAGGLAALLQRLIPRGDRMAVPLVIATTGFAEITMEILCLVGFQVMYGFVYQTLGLILAAFMLGLVVGGGKMTHRIRRGGGSFGQFTRIQIAVLLYPLALVGAFEVLSRVSLLRNSHWAAGVITCGLAFLAGFVGGLQFPLAARLHSRRGQAVRSAGWLYGADLLGSCFGALVVATLLIPVFGIRGTALTVAALGLAGLFVLITRPRSAQVMPSPSPAVPHDDQAVSTENPQENRDGVAR